MICILGSRCHNSQSTSRPVILAYVILREHQMIVVYGAKFHELGAQQCHTRPKVRFGAAKLLMSGVWSHAPHKFDFFLCHGFNNFWPLNILNWSVLWFCKSIPHGKKADHMAKSIPHVHVVCPYLPHGTYQMLYHVIWQQSWLKDDLRQLWGLWTAL